MGQKMIIGIDPGAQGGIAFLHKGKLTLHVMPIWTEEIPLSKPKKLKNGKMRTHRTETNISIKQLNDLLWDHRGAKVYCEHIKEIFGTSAQSNFKMGFNYGMVQAVLDHIFGDYFLVRPQEWTKEIWIDSDIVKKANKRNDTKATSLNAARRIFPGESFIAPNGKTPHDGLVDAALIAYYGSQR